MDGKQKQEVDELLAEPVQRRQRRFAQVAAIPGGETVAVARRE